MPEDAKQELLRIAQRALTIISDPACLGSDGELLEEHLDDVYSLLGVVFRFGPEEAFPEGRRALLWALALRPGDHGYIGRLDIHSAAVFHLKAALQVLLDDVSTTKLAVTKQPGWSKSSPEPETREGCKRTWAQLAAKVLQHLEDWTLPADGGEVLPAEYHSVLSGGLSGLVAGGVFCQYPEIVGLLAALGWRPRKSWVLMVVDALGSEGMEPSLRRRIEPVASNPIMVAQVTKALSVIARSAPEEAALTESPEGGKLRRVAKRQLKPGFMSTADIARHFGLEHKLDALRKRLDDWRRKNPLSQGWTEVSDTGPREPRYLYKVDAIQHMVADMIAKYRTSSETSSEPPASEKTQL